MKTKYPMKVGATLFPKGTAVVMASLEQMKVTWPGIARDPESVQVGVIFPGLRHPTIVHCSQLTSDL